MIKRVEIKKWTCITVREINKRKKVPTVTLDFIDDEANTNSFTFQQGDSHTIEFNACVGGDMLMPRAPLFDPAPMLLEMLKSGGDEDADA